MELLPEKRKEVAIAIYNPSPGTKAIDIRRQMVQLPEIAKALTGVDKFVFVASTKTLISDIDDETMVNKTSQMFKFIAMDVGFRIPTDLTEWQYICTRLVDLLKRYYSDLTLADIKLAFEMATMGELNQWLPKDSQGNPDKNHYQQFNADFFAKILNAYKHKRNNVIGKAFEALPKPSDEMTPEQIKYYSNQTKAKLILAYWEYKYTGSVSNMNPIREMLYYNRLVDVGLADSTVITDEDKQIALQQTLSRIAKGMVNQYEAGHIRRQGVEHETVKVAAIGVSKRRTLYNAFDEMILEEIQITDFIKLEK